MKRIKKHTFPISSVKFISYLVVGLLLFATFLLAAIPKELTIVDTFLIVIFGIFVIKLKLVRYDRKHYVTDASNVIIIKKKIFFLLFLGICFFAIIIDLFLLHN